MKRPSLLVACLMLAFMETLQGQPVAPGSPPAPPPSSRRAAGKPEGWSKEIESILGNLAAAYQKAESYRDQGRIKLVQQTGRLKTTTEMPNEIAFKRPNALVLDAGQHRLTCDGAGLYFEAPELRQYTAYKAPARLEKKHLQASGVMGGADEGHPELMDFLLRPDAYDMLVGQIRRVGLRPDATIDSVRCRVLEYETLQGTKLTNYIDASRWVLLKVEAETSANPPAAHPMVASPPQPATRLSYELTPVEINPELTGAMFSFKPPAGFKQVAQIGATDDSPATPRDAAPHAAETEGSHLVGKPAPPVSGNDLAGKPVTASDLQGRVVLLFFWAMSGEEHSLRAIPVVQAVADHFKNRPQVLVLGVSGDADQPVVVRQLMERKKASFRTLVDEEMRLQRSFQLGGVPTFVIIGGDGQVKWARLGSPPSLKEDLIRAVGQEADAGVK